MSPSDLIRAALIVSGCILAARPSVATAQAPARPQACDQAGLTLSPGFCASLFADRIGAARHLVVTASGIVYVNTWGEHHYAAGPVPAGGAVVALRDTTGNGKADVIQRFGPAREQGGKGGTGIALYQGALYVEEADRIERYLLAADSMVGKGPPEVIVSGLPLGGDHPMHPFVIDADGALYVDVASATNACQERNRQPHAAGLNPCRELQTRGGIWRFDARKSGQKFSPDQRYATGIRNAEGLAVDASGHGIWTTQHGRDQLHQNWPELYQPEQEATQPAEELMKVTAGGDYGWPECYYDEVQERLVLAPEFGGNGGKATGVCDRKLAPVASFPAHWAPDDAAIYTGRSFPAHYYGGAFIAFHGSWDRAPYPQGGYNIVFQPLDGTRATRRCEIFADGFAGAVKEPKQAAHRPAGVAVAPDGALFVSDDVHGSIFRITYRGPGAGPRSFQVMDCPPAAEPAGAAGAGSAPPPEGVHADAGRAYATLPVPPGSTRAMVALGYQVFHGTVGTAGCTGCHGLDGSGDTQGPDLTSKTYQLSDGSYEGIRKVIADGAPGSSRYTGAMPPMGGAQLTQTQLEAVTAYVWALGHR
jgi:glucose/arabinose dehydrogenase